jgi:glycosyltransferase involved in cell wall biosynthesis
MIINQNGLSNQKLPFFSVIITTYNRSALLVRALNSLISQTENDWEAIIIDDGSTDDTARRIAPFLKLEKNIHYAWQKSQGASNAKNTGVHLARGKYITFLDSDDEYYPCHLHSRRRILEAHPGVEFLYGGIKVVGNEYVPDKFDYGKMIHLNDCSVGGTFFIKKELFSSLEGFADIPLGSDADFFDRINSSGIFKIKAEAGTYIYHRENANSITNNLAGCKN